MSPWSPATKRTENAATVELKEHVATEGEDSKQKPALPVAGSAHCLAVPQCLEPATKCLPSSAVARGMMHPQCRNNRSFCTRKVYKLPTTGLKITLPIFTRAELGSLYATAYSGQLKLVGPTASRPTQQARMVESALDMLGYSGATGLHIMEMGCAAGYLLYNLRGRAGQNGTLSCFEGDPDYQKTLKQTLQLAKENTSGLHTKLKPKLFGGSGLVNSSVDVFLSSHTLEHLANPCEWLADVRRVLKPGGIVFTEVPDQYMDPDKKLLRGQFHLLFFNAQTYEAMMTAAGFQKVQMSTSVPSVVPGKRKVRSIFQKPR